MTNKIFGLVGPIASGKGVLGKHLKSMGYLYYSLSDQIRYYLAAEGIPINRTNLQDAGNYLRKTKGLGVLAEMTVFKVDGFRKNMVFDSIRNLGEIERLRKAFPNIMIVGIDAPVEVRLKRFLARAIERGEDGITEEDFWRANKRDLGEGTENGQQVDLCLLASDLIVDNPYESEGKFIQEASREIRQKYGFRIEGITMGGPERPTTSPERWWCQEVCRQTWAYYLRLRFLWQTNPCSRWFARW